MDQKQDVLGWQTTRWGMTKQEILSAVSAEVARETARTEYNKAIYSDLHIPFVDVAGFSFYVVFQMNIETDKLTQVLIQHDAGDKQPNSAMQASKTLLVERYGQPLRVGTSNEWEWSFPTTTINLGTTWIEGIMSLVNVRYFPTAPERQRQPVSAF